MGQPGSAAAQPLENIANLRSVDSSSNMACATRGAGTGRRPKRTFPLKAAVALLGHSLTPVSTHNYPAGDTHCRPPNGARCT
jgi:hypothetical protein